MGLMHKRYPRFMKLWSIAGLHRARRGGVLAALVGALFAATPVSGATTTGKYRPEATMNGTSDEQASGETEAHWRVVANDDDDKQPELTPEQKMAKRYPQPVQVSFLLGLPVLDEKSSIIGYVQAVVRTPEGKIQLVMPLGGFLGIGTRLVPIPIEIVGMLGAQVAVIDMPADRFMSAPTWTSSRAKPLDPSETIRVAITRR